MSIKQAHHHRWQHGVAWRCLLQQWRWAALVVAVLLAAMEVVHLIGESMEAQIHMQAFVGSLGGVFSREYCPDYLPLVREFLAAYYFPQTRVGGRSSSTGKEKETRRATGTPLVAAEEARVEAFLEAIGAFRFSIRRDSGALELRPRTSQTHRKRLADFKANVALAQKAFGPLPFDLDGWVVMGDRPTLSRADYALEGVRLPPVGFSMSKGAYDVGMPYMTQEAWAEEEELAQLADLVLAHPWDSKVARAIWRGSSTGQPEPDDRTMWTLPRAVLVNQSLHLPDLLDARLTSCKQCRGDVARLYVEAGYGYDGFVPFHEQFKYQALVDVDGAWMSGACCMLTQHPA